MTKNVSPAVLIALLAASCGGGTSTGPTEVPTSKASVATATQDPVTVAQAQATVSHGAGSTDATKLCAGIVQGVSCLVVKYARAPVLSATVQVTNSGSAAVWFNLTSYKKFSNGFEEQVKYDEGSARIALAPNASAAVSVTSFECQAQIDAYVGDEVNHPPHPPGVLLGYESTGAALCVNDPKPPPVVDVCPNLPGTQDKLPPGMEFDDRKNCVKPFVPPVEPPVEPPACPDFIAALTAHDISLVKKYVLPFNVHTHGEDEACSDIVVHDLPPGCTVPLSQGSYQRYNQQIRFPQKFIDNSNGEFANGTYSCIPVKKQKNCYQVDLRFGQTQAEDLTQTNESSDYGWRTLDYISNSAQRDTCPPIAVE